VAGTSESVAHLYADHHGWLKGWLRKKVGNSFDAADVAHDTFVSVIRAGNAHEVREPRSFLATIASRLLAGRYRRRLLEEAYLEALACLSENLVPSPEEQALTMEALQQVDQVLSELPIRAREAFLLLHIEGLSYAEIAARLGVSTSSVKQYLMRANKQCFFLMLQ
jgi:RNA polymerase sigma-19 factor, ECF subfamily